MAKVFRIITSGANEYKIANVLSAEISALGEYECTVWEEKKDYNANKATMSSSNYIIFIGPVKDAKALYESGALKWKYESEGMRYGWLGMKAVILVDPNFDLGKFVNNVAKNDNVKNVAAGALGMLAGGPLGAGIALGAKHLLFGKKKEETTEVANVKEEKRDILQCYKTLVEKFIAEDLNEFMGE